MSLYLIFFLVLCVIASYGFLRRFLTRYGLALAAESARQRRTQAFRHAFDCLSDLMRLLRLMQQYRGLYAIRYLGVDQHELLVERAIEIERLFSLLLQQLLSQDERFLAVVTPNNFKLVRYQWQLAVNPSFTVSAEQSFQQQTQLIEKIINWLRELARKQIEPELPSLAQGQQADQTLLRLRETIKQFAHTLPELAEMVARMRGLAMMLALARHTDIGKRAQIIHLMQQAETLLNKQSTLGGQLCTTIAQPVIHEAEQACHYFLRRLREQLLADQPSLGVEVIYQEGTAAVDALFVWMDQLKAGLLGRL
ncbi:hypothetical protein [Parvibium lacunae]|uniref:Nitrate/nitrite sensing protein domain-containing protein n=1 Tax=Parvibium lacunae TaxID=1888893 RepID=A0A368L7R5_9BURK|nr:hypothetical protein [Parvibium lacunae]RCS59657.1 hypothetical protein DU000_02815 [Parvibium lacunae]